MFGCAKTGRKQAVLEAKPQTKDRNQEKKTKGGWKGEAQAEAQGDC